MTAGQVQRLRGVHVAAAADSETAPENVPAEEHADTVAAEEVESS